MDKVTWAGAREITDSNHVGRDGGRRAQRLCPLRKVAGGSSPAILSPIAEHWSDGVQRRARAAFTLALARVRGTLNDTYFPSIVPVTSLPRTTSLK